MKNIVKKKSQCNSALMYVYKKKMNINTIYYTIYIDNSLPVGDINLESGCLACVLFLLLLDPRTPGINQSINQLEKIYFFI